MQENNETNNGGKNKVLLIVGGVIGVIVLGLVVIMLTARIKNNKNKVEAPPVETTPIVEEVEIPEIEEKEQETENDTEEDTDTEDERDNRELEYGYDNKVIGLRFNFDSNLYVKENTDELYNSLKLYTQEGKNFNIRTDSVDEMINIIKATTGEADGVAITVGIMPFQLGEVEQEEGAEPTQIADVLKDGLILDKYDKQIEAKITEQGGEIDQIEPSIITEEGYLVSERRYTDKEGKMVETKQSIIPAGANAIVVTLVSDGRPLEYSKDEMFSIIVESLVIDIPEAEDKGKHDDKVEEETEVIENTENK